MSKEKNMRFRLKLTTTSDLDLITLNCIPDFDFKVWIREALREYAKTGNVMRFQLPEPFQIETEAQSVMLSVTLDKRKDSAIMKWMKRIKVKHRSNAIKSVLRCSLSNPCLYAHFESFSVFFQEDLQDDNLVTVIAEPIKITSCASKKTNTSSQHRVKDIITENPIQKDETDEFDIFEFDIGDD